MKQKRPEDKFGQAVTATVERFTMRGMQSHTTRMDEHKVDGKQSKRGKKKDRKTRVMINEIDELEEAMDLLFGEQQEQTADRVKIKAQE